MATLQVQYKEGKFVSYRGAIEVEKFTENYIEANGWRGKIFPEGIISFWTDQYIEGEKHILKFKIGQKGYVRKSMKIGDNYHIKLKSYKLVNWPSDGIFGLGGEELISDKTIYFRTASFQKFLDDNKLTAVRYENPNGQYKLYDRRDEEKELFCESVLTDGRIQTISSYCEKGNKFDKEHPTVVIIRQVSDASWLIKTVVADGKIKHRILYTLDQPQEIENLPIIEV